MSARKNPGRHRAVTAKTSTLATISRTATGNAGGVGRQATVIAAASGLVLTSGIAAQAADAPAQRDSAPVSNLEVSTRTPAALSADASVRIAFERGAHRGGHAGDPESCAASREPRDNVAPMPMPPRICPQTRMETTLR
ncbi:hypothetical protein [Arthrobacter sp. EM1]|uniref:hypothetical protein n=1 Tax=Arthrobacter sp. EM1 TaxID=3043847 RepID=UPI00249F05AE|nr:hypothetical protein [Arthrobacter sp. EM1]WGZ80799.1 hypothetical protein QI450_06315 [Arthrobacter sp. EM1]